MSSNQDLPILKIFSKNKKHRYYNLILTLLKKLNLNAFNSIDEPQKFKYQVQQPTDYDNKFCKSFDISFFFIVCPDGFVEVSNWNQEYTKINLSKYKSHFEPIIISLASAAESNVSVRHKWFSNFN